MWIAKHGTDVSVAVALCTLLGMAGCGDNGALLIDSPEPPNVSLPTDGGASDGGATDGGTGDAPVENSVPIGVAQGPCHGCAWRGGRAFCWGDNSFGELGDGSRDSRP